MNRDYGIAFRDPDAAFESAIRDGRLSDDQDAANYAGRYMYMGTQTASYRPIRQQRDLFKHIDTRAYLP